MIVFLFLIGALALLASAIQLLETLINANSMNYAVLGIYLLVTAVCFGMASLIRRLDQIRERLTAAPSPEDTTESTGSSNDRFVKAAELEGMYP